MASDGGRKFLVAAIFLWFVHTWMTIVYIPHHPTSDAPFLGPGHVGGGAPGPAPPASSSSASSRGFDLAREQSDGFFDDITDAHWRTLQKHHAALFPNYYDNLYRHSHGPDDRGNYGKLRHSAEWYGQNFHVEFVCPLMRRLPADSMSDGPKWICDPHRIARKKDCLVYSVGSNGKAEFERAVKEEIGDHCEIHTFDLIACNKRNGCFDVALQNYSTFHHWGIATPATVENNSQKGKKFKTLKQTMEDLGHTGRTIDIFKIDCEWCEWFTWPEWMTVDMRQILVETHNAPMPNARDFFFNLHDKGFVIFSKEANYENGAGGVEYAFVKLSTDFFLNDTMYYKHSDLLGSKP